MPLKYNSKRKKKKKICIPPHQAHIMSQPRIQKKKHEVEKKENRKKKENLSKKHHRPPPTSEAFQRNQWPHLHCIIVFAALHSSSKTSRAESRNIFAVYFLPSCGTVWLCWEAMAGWSHWTLRSPRSQTLRKGGTAEQQIMLHSPLNATVIGSFTLHNNTWIRLPFWFPLLSSKRQWTGAGFWWKHHRRREAWWLMLQKSQYISVGYLIALPQKPGVQAFHCAHCRVTAAPCCCCSLCTGEYIQSRVQKATKLDLVLRNDPY